MNCIQALDIVSETLDGALELHLHAELDEHLRECPSCRNYVEQLRISVETLRRSPKKGKPNPRRSELIEEYRKKFR